jgi:hypothetical protein
MREALNYPGLDGVASVHYDNRYTGRALHGGECGGIPASDEEIDLIGDHSIHRIRKPLQPSLRRKSLKDDVLAFDVTAGRVSIDEVRSEDTGARRPNVHNSDAKDLCR